MSMGLHFKISLCSALAICVSAASLHSQDSQPRRIIKASNTIRPENLDPGLIESEAIESEMIHGTVDVQSLPGRQSQPTSESYFNNATRNDHPIKLESPKPSTRNQTALPVQRPAIDQFNSEPPPAPEATVNRTIQNNRNIGQVTVPNTDSGMYETSSTPTVQTQIIAPRTINVDQTARMFIQVQNVGKANVESVKLIATLPDHAKFVDSVPQPAGVNGRSYEFIVSGLGANAKQVVQLDIIPTAKIPLNVSTQIQIESQQQVAVTVQQPVLDITVSGPSAIQTGQPVKHVVTVKNVGDGVAESVRFSSELPENMQLDQQQQKTLVPKLIPGQIAKFELSSYARSPGDSSIVFQVSADGAETRTDSASIRVVRPELNVQILGPQQNYLGRDGVYSIELENSSEIDINDVAVELTVPNGLQINTISQQAQIDRNTGTLSWKFKKIPGQQQQLIQFKAKAVAEGHQDCIVKVSTKETGSRQMALTTDVRGRADLSIRISDSGEALGIGGKTDVTIEIANHGSSAANQVKVQVELPSGLMPVNQPGYSIDPSGNFINFANINIESGGSKTFTFKVVAANEGEHIIRGSVSLEGSSQTISSESSIFVFESENTRVSEALVPDIRR